MAQLCVWFCSSLGKPKWNLKLISKSHLNLRRWSTFIFAAALCWGCAARFGSLGWAARGVCLAVTWAGSRCETRARAAAGCVSDRCRLWEAPPVAPFCGDVLARLPSPLLWVLGVSLRFIPLCIQVWAPLAPAGTAAGKEEGGGSPRLKLEGN